MRVALGIEYDGAGFHGWQQQRGVRTVQPHVEAALGRVADHPVRVHCAGRTDAGVHAAFQVVHFETTARREPRAWVLGANALLPSDAGVLWACPVNDAFHARFSAISRGYHYLVSNRRTRPGLWHGRVTWECRPLDVGAMAEAARALVGEHDFSSFRARGCQAKHPVRHVTRLEVARRHDLIVLAVDANAFLQHMVRNIAGVLIEIGRGARPVGWAAEVLDARRREQGGVTAPPDGLYLSAVRYPGDTGIPAPPPFIAALPGWSSEAFL